MFLEKTTDPKTQKTTKQPLRTPNSNNLGSHLSNDYNNTTIERFLHYNCHIPSQGKARAISISNSIINQTCF